MNDIAIKRSPLFYVGDKYKLIKQLRELFPIPIDSFFEPFVGGGTVFLNVEAKRYYLNDIDENLVRIHRCLLEHSNSPDIFFNDVENVIYKYNLSRSYKEDIVPETLKKEWKKTYFARFNKHRYEKLREDFNKLKNSNPLIMYVLLIYGFNRMLRFNRNGKFNLPVGNVDFNNNVINALENYFDYVRNKRIKFESDDFRKFLTKRKYSKHDFVYLDPPYLITFSEYNKFWNEDCEADLLDIIDDLDKKGVRFALSNVTEYKGRKNNLLVRWMKKYNKCQMLSNYISYYNNSKKDINEVLITNYDKNKQ